MGPYAFNLDIITATNLEDAISELPRDTQLTDLNIAIIYSIKDANRFMIQYRTWFRVRHQSLEVHSILNLLQRRAFSQTDEHFLRMYQITNGKSRLKSWVEALDAFPPIDPADDAYSSHLDTLARAVVTYEAIFSTTKDAGKPDVALAAANKLIDYVLCCYCTGMSSALCFIYLLPLTIWYRTTGGTH